VDFSASFIKAEIPALGFHEQLENGNYKKDYGKSEKEFRVNQKTS